MIMFMQSQEEEIDVWKGTVYSIKQQIKSSSDHLIGQIQVMFWQKQVAESQKEGKLQKEMQELKSFVH